MAFKLKTKDQAVDLPVGAFPKTGFVGAFQAAMQFSTGIFAPFNLTQYQMDVQAEIVTPTAQVVDTLPMDGDEPNTSGDFITTPAYFRASQDNQSFFYYFGTHAEGKAFCNFLERVAPGEYPWRTSQHWRFWANMDTVYVRDKSKFGNTLSMETRFATWKSGKHRHEFQLMTLPSFVAAYATAMGIDNPGFSLDELQDGEAIFTQAFQDKMIGSKDAEYTKSELFKRRAALWTALGEESPMAYTLNTGGKLDVQSDIMQDILGAVVSPWAEAYYARIVPTPDPRLGAAYGDNQARPNIPCFAEFYESKEEAEAWASTQGLGADADGADAPADGEGLKVPQIWQSAPDQWADQVKGIMATVGDLSSLPDPVAQQKVAAAITQDELGYDLGADAQTVHAWIKHLGNQD